MRAVASAVLATLIGSTSAYAIDEGWTPQTGDDYVRAAWVLYDQTCGVSLELPESELTALLGADGAGKCTLINEIAQVYLSHVLALEEAQKRAGLEVDLPPFPDFEDEISARIAELVSGSGTPAWHIVADPNLSGAPINIITMAVDASMLSYGMAQRLAISTALANDPEVLMLDEPTTALDAETAAAVEAAMEEAESAAAGSAAGADAVSVEPATPDASQ